ncbi:thioredoxin family protein [Pseudomonas purpurea]|uniref:thioredoxin family protein n=1 Tax=Pseudomonas purpurea TaxID=3136737 RepID=UPI0032662A79
MNAIITRIATPQGYRKALSTYRPVIMYFGHPSCYACEMAGPIFQKVARPYVDQADIYMLDTSESPRHQDVTGTPTVLFFNKGKLVQKLKGFESKALLEQIVTRHVGKIRPKPLDRIPRHDLTWLKQTLKKLCMAPRGYTLLERRLAHNSLN